MAPTPASTPKPVKTAANLAPISKVPDFSKLDEFVTFIIGPKKTKFLVHKNFACDSSPVLKAAFNGPFVEGQTQTYKLDDTTENAFTLLSQFFYTQKLDGDLGGKDNVVLSLCRLWILAEKLPMPRLQNISIDRIEGLRLQENQIDATVFMYVWDNTVYGSPLRRLFHPPMRVASS
ncbi:hypothetical protein N431DRAFT_457902 [Stipitochalara longipes BDJ]|nr:hypothetical protein N431DRAFT_457902 [Stipitochalara longipes BDJ]